MNKKRTYKLKILNVFWTHIFVIITLLYFVSSELNDLNPKSNDNERDGEILRQTRNEQSMCNEDNCYDQNSAEDNPESLALKTENGGSQNDTDESLEEDFEHPDGQMTSDITGIITSTQKIFSTTEATVLQTTPRVAPKPRQKPAQTRRRYQIFLCER